MVSFREVEPGAHRHRVRDMSWGQAQPRALKGVLQEQYREHGVGTGISDSHHPTSQSKQPQLLFQSQVENGDSGEATRWTHSSHFAAVSVGAVGFTQ